MSTWDDEIKSLCDELPLLGKATGRDLEPWINKALNIITELKDGYDKGWQSSEEFKRQGMEARSELAIFKQRTAILEGQLKKLFESIQTTADAALNVLNTTE